MPKLKQTPKLDRFTSPAEAAAILGCSQNHLRMQISYWEYGVQYLDARSPTASRPAWRYNVEKIQEWFLKKPEKRG